MGPLFRATWGDDTLEILYGECDASASSPLSEWEPDWVSKAPTPSKEPKKRECLEREPSPRGMVPEPCCVERGLPPCRVAPKLGLDKTMDVLSRVVAASHEDPDLSALSAALKAKLGLSDLKKPPSGVQLLTKDMKSCRGIHSSSLDTCCSSFQARARTAPVCSVGDTIEAEMKSYGLAALAQLATTHPSPNSGGTGDPGVPVRGTKAIATANVQIEVPELDPKNLPDWAQEFSKF